MIELKDVTFSYFGAERAVLNRVNLTVNAGEFVLVCGATGSGKSTLLRIFNGLAPHFTGGTLSGQLIVNGINRTGNFPHELASEVGFVNQQPEASFVTDVVQDELAFGMEQLGFERNIMHQAIARVAKLLEIEELLDKPLAWLSGGQQQRVAIAAALAAGQKILILDEPTSALDPKLAAEVISILERLSREHQIAVILVEHRIERVLEVVDSIIVVGNDGLVTKGGAEQFQHYDLVPPVIELAKRLSWNPIPVSVPEARKIWLSKNLIASFKQKDNVNAGEIALKVAELSVSFGETQAISKISFTASTGEIVAIVGPNGSGKSTLLWAIQGSGKRSGGEVWTRYGDPIAVSPQQRLSITTLVPQRAQDLLFLNSLADELEESDRFAEIPRATTANVFEALSGRVDPSIHPRDLSAGQQLALVLALQIVKGAGIILLDEPTRGLDYAAKKALCDQLRNLRSQGCAILIASHDTEFVALIADRVLRIDSGKLVSDEIVSEALGCNSALATQIAQIAMQPGLVNLDQLEGVSQK